jgi:hypothetical protein
MLSALAAVIGILTMTAVGQDSTSAINTAVTPSTTQDINNAQFATNIMMTDNAGFAGGYGMFGIKNIEISSDYTANVISILNNDSDVLEKLLSQGYNVTSIDPIVKNVIEGNETIATQAATAKVILTNGTSGYATVNVDVANAKVTQIIIIVRTVIDKTTS